MTDFPVIDISQIEEPSAQLEIAKLITTACQNWGFLLLKNHGIPTSSIHEMFNLSHSFFAETPENQKAPYKVTSRAVGYASALSDRRGDDKATVWLAGKPGFLSSPEVHDSVPPFWRDKLDTVDAFKRSCHQLVLKLLVCFALALDLADREFFAKAHGEDEGDGNQFRLLWYPPRGNEPNTNVTRMTPHSDSGSVTLLFQTCAGLEVEAPDGRGWVAAPHLDDHILVNLGDALALWSGGQLKATKHRVTFDGVPHNQERMTMAYFGKATPSTRLDPLPVPGVQRLEHYDSNGISIPAGITVGELTKKILAGIYGHGTEKPHVEPARKESEVAA